MGFFIEPVELQDLTDDPELKELDPNVLDELLIYPAERRIEEVCNLQLDTNMDPEHWVGWFTARPKKRTLFQADYRRAVLALVTHWAKNREFRANESITGASVTFGPKMPPTVHALMRRWGIQKRVRRI